MNDIPQILYRKRCKPEVAPHIRPLLGIDGNKQREPCPPLMAPSHLENLLCVLSSDAPAPKPHPTEHCKTMGA